jgi:hypothetical protein
MMTRQLEKEVYSKMSAEGTVGTLQASHDKSEVTITSIDSDQADPLVYHILATRVDITANGPKSYSGVKKSEAYTIHLVETDRTIQTPSGLLISGFKRDEISSEAYLLDQQ